MNLKRGFRIPILFILWLSLSAPSLSSSPAETAERRIVKMLRTTAIPGMSVTVIREGSVVFSKGFGNADLENKVKATPETRFRLASVSKLITAAAVARLVDSGKLDLDAPISKYVKDLPIDLGNATVRQLTGHLAGVRHYQRKDFFPSSIDNKNFATIESSLAIFKNDPLVAPPGTKYSYTTFGFTLLADIIAKASGKPFLEYVDKEVFSPLGILSGGPDAPSEVIPNRTSFYMNSAQNKILNAPFVNPSYKWAGGGLLMNSLDLARFGIAHVNSGFISKDVRDQMFVSQQTADGKETGVGITWRIAKGYFGNDIYHHEGSMHGARSALLIYPEKKLSVALLSNFSGTPRFAFQTAQLIAEPFLNESHPVSFDPTGRFEVEGTALRRPVKGLLTMKGSKGAYTGSFEFGSEKFEVIGAIGHPNGYYLVITHRIGGLDVVPVFKNGEKGTRYDLSFRKLS